MLRAIEEKLFEISDKVFYGSADDVENTALWNYVVFSRDKTSRATNNTGYTDYFTVAIIHEDYVPDEMVEETIDKLEALPGVRLAKTDVDYYYSRKPSTNAVIEIATLTFSRARRRV